LPGLSKSPQFSEEIRHDFQTENEQKAALVRFASPAILAFLYFIVAASVEVREVFEMLKRQAKQNTEAGRRPLGHVLLTCMALLVASVFAVYLGVALTSFSDLIGKTTLAFGAITSLAIIGYLGFVFGFETMWRLAEKDETVKQVVLFLHSIPFKGGVALLLLPFLPLALLIDIIHQAFRKVLSNREVLTEKPNPERTTKNWQHLKRWERAAVFQWSMLLGIAVAVFRVVAAFIPPFMIWLKGELGASSWPVVLVVSFVVSIVLFLLPPVSGQMIYLPISLILIEKYGYDSAERLIVAIVIASVFCTVMKLVASTLQQKLIGAPFAKNVTVKKAFGLHGNAFRIARSILSQRGMSWKKVLVLIGMPDWPVSVLCGVLDLAIFPVMIGTSPEIIKIIPNCCAFGFLLKSREQTDMQNTFNTLYFVALALAVMIPGVLTLGVAVLVKREIDMHKDVFDDPNSNWFRDPQEAEILAAIEQDNKETERLAQLTSWNVQPTWVRLVMIAGAVSASLSLYMQGGKAFETFQFQDPRGLDQLPDGKVVNLIRPGGYGMIGLAGVTILFLAIFKLWSVLQSSKKQETDSPVSQEQQMKPEGSEDSLPGSAAV
jgi:ABC-type proline/glycine betaine transport system permease subunit